MPNYSREQLERILQKERDALNKALAQNDTFDAQMRENAIETIEREIRKIDEADRAAAQEATRVEETPDHPVMRAGRWAKRNAKPLAAGAAAGAAATEAWTHQQARQGLQAAANRAGYAGQKIEEHAGKIAGTGLFMIVSAIVIFFEYLSASQGNWTARVGVYLGIIFLIFILTRSVPLTQRALLAAFVVNAGWWLYLSGSDIAFMKGFLAGDAGLAIATLLLLPGMVWYLLFFEPDLEIAGLFKGAGTIAVGIMFFAFVFPQLTSIGGLVPTPPGGFDTGEAAQDALQFTLSGFGDGFESFACWLGFNQGCGFAGWLNEQIAPFAYDATTVHELQNEDLGVYIIDEDRNKEFTINPQLSFDYLPGGVNFKISAPIPQDLGFEFCRVNNSLLKGFEGLCNNPIILSCDADVARTTIEPTDTLTISQAVSSQGRLFTCRISPPTENTRSTDVTIRAEYPFATNTYKLIRAVDGTRTITNEEIRELNSFDDDFIISTGGPVVVETDESNYISVQGPGHREQLILTFQAEKDVRLKAIDDILIYVPDGAVLVDKPESYCGVEQVSCASFKETCEYVKAFAPSHVTEDMIPACRTSDACENGEFASARSGNIYSVTSAQNLSFALGDSEGTENSIQIACELNITEPSLFLSTNQLATERALNVIASYDVEHRIETRVDFEGSAPVIPRSSFGLEETCRVGSATIPTGQVPLTFGPIKVTQGYGSEGNAAIVYKDGHRGVDFGAAEGDVIVASWPGTVMMVCDGDNACSSRWETLGNMVVLRTKLVNGGSFDHMYAHLSETSVEEGDTVSAGQKIGNAGSTGTVTGPHLHLETRLEYTDTSTDFNALAHLYHPELLSEENVDYYQAARSTVRCTQPTAISNSQVSTVREKVISKLNLENPTKAHELQQAKNLDIILAAAQRNGIPPEVALGIAYVENKFIHTEARGVVIESSTGDIGLMQVNHENPNGLTYCFELAQRSGLSPTPGATRDYDYTNQLKDVEFNALCAMEILTDKKADNERRERDPEYQAACGASCKAGCRELTGWKAHVKAYNGWGNECGPGEYEDLVETAINSTLNLTLPRGWT